MPPSTHDTVRCLESSRYVRLARTSMTTLAAVVHSLGRPRLGQAEFPARFCILLIVISGAIYGAVMGSFHLVSFERSALMLYGAIKVPLLIFLTTLICLPAFFVINSALGLRRDFPVAARAVLSAQAALTLALASLAPFTRFVYFCGVTHTRALVFNAAMFTLATLIGQVILLRRYRPLIAASATHRYTLWLWVIMYAFVGMQSGWMLRPFVGTPNKPVAFLRDEPFTNAYIVVLRLLNPW